MFLGIAAAAVVALVARQWWHIPVGAAVAAVAATIILHPGRSDMAARLQIPPPSLAGGMLSAFVLIGVLAAAGYGLRRVIQK